MGKKVWRVGKIALLLVGLGIIIFSDFRERQARLRILPTQGELASVLPGALLKDRKEKPIPHYPGRITVEGKSKRAVALLTAELPPRVKGFVDQINILFSIDEDGNILKLRVISHKETPYYFRLLRGSGFLDQLLGRKVSKLDEIKTVSGATISSRAILEDLQGAGQLALAEIFQKEVGKSQSVSLSKIYLQPKTISLMAVLLLGLIVRYFRTRWYRWLVFGLSIIVVGFWLKSPFALPHLFQIFALQVPVRGNPYLVLLGGFVILTTIFSGPLWCTYLCPYAGLQELLSRFGKKSRWHPSSKALRSASELRWLILFLAVVLYFGLGIKSSAELEPFFHLFSSKWTLAGMALVLVTLLGSFFLPRFWCRFFCPTGACLILLSSHRKLFRTIEKGIEESGLEPSEPEGDR